MFGKKKKATILYDGYDKGTIMRKCPHCGKKKPITDFGMRAMTPGGRVREQSWCKACRSSR